MSSLMRNNLPWTIWANCKIYCQELPEVQSRLQLFHVYMAAFLVVLSIITLSRCYQRETRDAIHWKKLIIELVAPISTFCIIYTVIDFLVSSSRWFDLPECIQLFRLVMFRWILLFNAFAFVLPFCCIALQAALLVIFHPDPPDPPPAATSDNDSRPSGPPPRDDLDKPPAFHFHDT